MPQNYLPLILSLLFFCSCNLLGQHPFYYNLNTEQDLPSNEVYSIKQDSFGYIWLGCDAGLFRYDGFRFKQYRNKQMAGRSISGLVFDPMGRLWCRNFNGQLLQVSGDSLIVTLDFSKTEGQYFFCFDAESRLWVADAQKVRVYAPSSLHLVKEISLQHLGNGYNVEIGCAGNLIYLARGSEGLLSINPQNFEIEKIDAHNLGEGANFQKHFRSLFFSSGQLLYFFIEFYDGGHRIYELYQLKNKELKFLHRFHSGSQSHFLYNIKDFGDNTLWICSSNGAFRLQHADSEGALDAQKLLLPKQRISDILLDREGNYWLSSLQNGIFILPSLDILHYSPDNCSGLLAPQLTRLHASAEEQLWIGAHNGQLMRLDPQQRQISSHYDNLNPPYRAVKSFFEDDNYFCFSRNSNSSVSKKSRKGQALSIGDARALWIDQDTLFFVSPNRLAKAYSVHQHLEKGQNWDSVEVLSHTGGWSLAYDSSMQALWVTLSSGLHYYQNGVLTPVYIDSLPIYGGYMDYEGGILWLASMNSGLYGFEQGKVKYHFGEAEGLSSNSPKSIKAAGDYIWVTSANTLYRINPTKGEIHSLGRHLGIYAKDVEAMEWLNDTLYLATHKGLIQLPAAMSGYNPIAPSIRIEGVYLSDSLLSDIGLGLSLPYRHPQLRIEFSATAIRSRGDFYYEYRLLGLDSTWARVNAKNNFVNYTAIPPGNYTFELRAVNESGVASRQSAKLLLKIASPIWQRSWFFILLGLLFILLFFAFYSIRVRLLTRRFNLEKNLASSQLTALKAQMNPHFMYNALNSIQDLILMQDIKNANLYLNKFSSLMRSILNASDSEEIRFEEELSILKLYLDLEKLRFGDDFVYTFTVDDAIDPEFCYIASMIIQPYIENAVKHGLLHKKGLKQLSIDFVKEKGAIRCTITDNGVGRKRATEIKERGQIAHRSFATRATERRLEILNAFSKDSSIGVEITDLYVADTTTALGTQVQLYIPYKTTRELK